MTLEIGEVGKEIEETGITTITISRKKLEAARRRMGTSTASATIRRLVDLYLGAEGEEIEDEKLRGLMKQKREVEENRIEAKKRLAELEAEEERLQMEIFGKIPSQVKEQVEVKVSEKAEVQEAYVKKVNEFIKADPEYREVWEFQSFVPEEIMEKYVGLHKGEMGELEMKNEKQMISWLVKVTEGKLCVKVK